MAGIVAFLLLFLMFGGSGRPACPPLYPEVVEQHECMTKEDGIETSYASGTVRVNITSIKNFSLMMGTTSFGADGTVCVWKGKPKTVESAANIEHNKRVKECRTNNGEF